MFVIQPCVCGEMQLSQEGPRYHNGQHGLQPRAPNTRGHRVNSLLHIIQGCQPFHIIWNRPIFKASVCPVFAGIQHDHLDNTNNKPIIIFPKHCLNCERSRSRKTLRPRPRLHGQLNVTQFILLICDTDRICSLTV